MLKLINEDPRLKEIVEKIEVDRENSVFLIKLINFFNLESLAVG